MIAFRTRDRTFSPCSEPRKLCSWLSPHLASRISVNSTFLANHNVLGLIFLTMSSGFLSEGPFSNRKISSDVVCWKLNAWNEKVMELVFTEVDSGGGFLTEEMVKYCASVFSIACRANLKIQHVFYFIGHAYVSVCLSFSVRVLVEAREQFRDHP